MKKQYSNIILLLALLISGGAQADVFHYVGANVHGGEWTLWHPANLKYMDKSYGVGGGLGFNYELQSGDRFSDTRFLFDIGLTVIGGTTTYTPRNEVHAINISYNNDPFRYVYEVKNRRDTYTKIAAQVPILFGVQKRRFYMLAGVKIGYHVTGSWSVKCDITTYGEDPDIVGVKLTDNGPDDQFYSTPQLREENNKTNPAPKMFPIALDGTIELGARLGSVPDGTGYDVKRSTVEYRLAAFLDVTAYGGYRKYDNLQKIIEYPNKYSQTLVKDVQLHDFLSVVQPKAAGNYGIKTGSALGRNIMAGIKFTVLFQLPEKRGCVICGDNYHGGGF